MKVVARLGQVLAFLTLATGTRVLLPSPRSVKRRQSRYRLGPDNRYVLDGDGRPIPRSFA